MLADVCVAFHCTPRRCVGSGSVREGQKFLAPGDDKRFFDCYDAIIERGHITLDQHR